MKYFEMNKTVVIPAAGLGSRLKNLTKNYSKAMCTLGSKPVISHIIEKFEKTDEIIVLLGYKGDLLKQVIKACHPDYDITFIEVDKYEGEDSGLGYSLHCAKQLLQKPFIFWSCDTVLPDFNPSDEIDRGIGNFVVVSKVDEDKTLNYRKVAFTTNKDLVGICPKVARQTDNVLSYTGVAYIDDYESFWKAEERDFKYFVENGESAGLQLVKSIKVITTTNWIDTGYLPDFERAKAEYSKSMKENILEKPDEAIWFIGDRVIKFHIDPKFIADRVKRFSTFLSSKQIDAGIKIPELLNYSDNTYTYKRADGVIMSDIVNGSMLRKLFNAFFNYNEQAMTDEQKLNIYEDFYHKKTISRINKYLSDFEDTDDVVYINGEKCLSAIQLVNDIDWERLSKGGIFTSNYHGDFHLENILKNDDGYVMLDWRQNFGKSDFGDVYYDLAKMWHSLIVNHSMVRKELFEVETIGNGEYRIDIHRTFIDTECEKVLVEHLEENPEINPKQAELLTAIIFLNIAACHIYPYSKFLFYLGKYMINKFYQKHNEYFKN